MPYHPDKLTHPSQAKTSASTSTQPPWNPIGDLSPAHIEMLKQHVHGMPMSKIVYHLKRQGVKYSHRQISRVIESEKGRQYASLYSALYFGGMTKLVEEGASHAPEALHTELSIMRNPLSGNRHRLAAAADLMDRTGPIKVSRQEVANQQPTQVFITLSPSQLSQFAAPPAEIEAEVVTLLEQPSSNNDD